MKKIVIYMAFIAVMLFSCNNGMDQKDRLAAAKEKVGIGNHTIPKQEDQNKVDTSHEVAYSTIPTKNYSPHEDWDKKIIKTAEVTLELKNYSAYDRSIHSGLRAYGAYIAEEEQSLSEDRSSNAVTIKVPVDQFDNLLNSFAGDSSKVLEKKISSDDVTGEVIDTKSRMEAKKQMRDRYLALLKQAKNMKEVLEVQAEINSIQEEIESAGGRVNYLTHQSAYSTVHLTYFQYLAAGNRSNGNNIGYLVKLKDGFRLGIDVIGGLFIFMVTIWPILLIIGIGIFAWRRKKNTAAGV